MVFHTIESPVYVNADIAETTCYNDKFLVDSHIHFDNYKRNV